MTGHLRRAIGLAAMLLAAGCGGDGGTPASRVAVVDVAPTPVPTSIPTPTPTAVATPIAVAMTGAIVQAGDSIGIGLGAGDWAAVDHLGFPAGVAIHNVSVSGKAMEAGYGLRATELFPFRANQGPSVLVIQQGSNDLYYGTSATALYRAVLTPFVASARAAGFYVMVDTVLPRQDGGWTAAMEGQRVAYNALVRTSTAGPDAVDDVAADPVIGDGSNPATSPLYADGVHPNLLGQQRLALLKAAALAPLLQNPARAVSR